MNNTPTTEGTISALNVNLNEETLTFSSEGKIITNVKEYVKYDKNLNNRPDYELDKLIIAISWIHYIVLFFSIIIFCVFLCIPDFTSGNKGSNNSAQFKVFIITFIISFVTFTIIPYSIKYRINFRKKKFTYQYNSFIPFNFFLSKQYTINIEDAVYFREEFTILEPSGFIIVKRYILKLMKMNKNNEEIELLNLGKFVPVMNDIQKMLIHGNQKLARLLNEIIGFDINLMKDIKKAYVNKDNIALQNISSQMPQDKKNLFQNIFNKMGIDIKLL